MTGHGTRDKTSTSSMGEGTSSGIADSITTGSTQQTGETQDKESPFAGEAVGQIEALGESFATGSAKKSITINRNPGFSKKNIHKIHHLYFL